MASEPDKKRVITFVDGQNLYHCAREAFGVTHPNYDIMKLSQKVCSDNGWDLVQARFYTGFPAKEDNQFWNSFWQKKFLHLSRQGVFIFKRHLRYRTKSIKLPDGTPHFFPVAEEKGVDVRIAIDVIRLALDGAYDVAVLFSQDQDLSEAADEVRAISRRSNRWIKIASAYPCDPSYLNKRGVDKTDWLRIYRSDYEACIDPTDYR